MIDSLVQLKTQRYGFGRKDKTEGEHFDTLFGLFIPLIPLFVDFARQTGVFTIIFVSEFDE
jgi:hypothetical protein